MVKNISGLLFRSFVFVLLLCLMKEISFAQQNFQMNPAHGCGQAVVNAISLLSSGGYVPVPQQTTGITYVWDFGNGQSSVATNPSGIIYSDPGDYQVFFQATIDTTGFVLTGVDITAVACTDPFGGAPDMYIIIADGNNQIVYSTQSSPINDTDPPVSWALSLPLTTPPYHFWIWDEDSFDSDDNCVNNNEAQPGVSTLVMLPPNTSAGFGMTSSSSVNGGLAYTLHFYKEVSVITDSMIYSVYDLPAPPVTNIINAWYCEGQQIPDITALHQPGYIVTWYADATLSNPIFTGSEYAFPHTTQGTYNLFVTQTDPQYGCESQPAQVTVVIGLLQAPFVINGNSVFCEGESLPPLIAGGHQVFWFEDSALNSLIHTGDTLNLTMINSGVYHFWVQYEDISGCISETTHVTIEITPFLQAEMVSTPVSCFGNNDGQAEIVMLNGYPPYQYFWSNGQNTNTAIDLPFGSVSVSVVDSVYCLRTFLTEIENAEPIFIEAEVSGASCLEQGNGGSIVLDVSGGEPPYLALWNNQDEGLELFGLEPGTYDLALTDSKNCAVDSTFLVGILNDCLEIATVLTPNGDGLNDTWQIRSIEFFPESIIHVFDRNGLTVFHSKGIYTPWDGRYGGKILPVGSYFYSIQLSPFHEPYLGIVDIIR
jgi:gliding motility-associated-like protein